MKSTKKCKETIQSDAPEAPQKAGIGDPQQPDHITHITHMAPPNPNEFKTIHVNQDHIVCAINYNDFRVMRLSNGAAIKYPAQELKTWGRYQVIVGEVIN